MTTTGWPTVRLGDITEFKYGKSLPKGKRSGSGAAVFGSNGEVGRHSDVITEGSTIIVGRKGSFGEVNFSDDPCWPIDTTYFVDESATDAELRWLYYCLKMLPLKDLNRAATIPGLNRDDAYAQKVLLPPIEEQRRIAAVLDAADALRAKRRRALAKLDTLTQSIFIDLLATDQEGWTTAPIGSVAAARKGSIRTGPFGSQLLHDEFTESGIAVLGIDNAVNNAFRWERRRYISPEKYDQLRRYTVFPGDVLITIMGTCGRVAIVPEDIPTAINTKHLCCVTLDKDKCTPEWLWACLMFHPHVRDRLGATHGAVMPGLNMGKIKQAEIPLPPIDIQRTFSAWMRRVETQHGTTREAADALDALFASLQQRAFRGEL